jgi:hypothetical protein
MHADISRDSFDPDSHTLRVVQEQGALLLDADANEQTAALLHRLHTLAGDLFGPYWGPADGSGFKIDLTADKKDLTVSPGRYYVSGLLCENPDDFPVTFLTQPSYPGAAFPAAGVGNKPFDPTKPFAVYLDVWEREVTETEMRASPGQIDPALQTLSPTPRTQLVWQVKVFQDLGKDAGKFKQDLVDNPSTAVALWVASMAPPAASPGKLTARVRNAQTGTHEGDYTGPENQLYRVEIHRGGTAYQAGALSAPDVTNATFKWARDNGSVVFPLTIDSAETVWQPDPKAQTFVVALANTGRDARTGLTKGDWVEYTDPATAFAPELFSGKPIRQLFKVVTVGSDTVTLWSPTSSAIPLPTLPERVIRWAFLRRWDFRPFGKVASPSHATGAPPADDGALLVVAPAAGSREWLDVEVGIQVRFELGKNYRPGDYWLIPARTASGAIVWPQMSQDSTDPHGKKTTSLVPRPVKARNADHAYAPLAIIDPATATTDARRVLNFDWSTKTFK